MMETAIATSTASTTRSTCSVLTTTTTTSRGSGTTSRSKDQVRSRLLNNLGIFNGAVDNAPNPAIARKIKIIRAMGLGGVIPPKPRSHHHHQKKASSNGQTVTVDNENVRPKINFSQITHEPLKYKEEDDDIQVKVAANSSLSNSNSSLNTSTSHSNSNGNNNNSNNGSSTSSNGDKNDPNKKPQRRKICFNDSVSVAHIPMRSEYSDRVRSRMWSNRYEIHENATRNAIEFQAEGWDWRSVVTDEGMFVCTYSGELIHPVHCQQ
mmetsp:Transcript_12760/g.19331  ORF Transcript_12760/g.19331 Transcript_12760/m.19331 type:complete len:265 (-) Transcript_12760:624-1418(-)|eukprot:CAMPEP_0203633704 /NCGR_PEP_ID=MMETSP0088-20131115/799_1 /ASSEMBLY_ACC=CAM_ASM_001087 /TAXON_ID=426623 /ORGANISM="Chaetoceros affinis, Strain CCMP159" /LENGTH=264 /DNA_ID=CAMNT_0050487107 /DNA_START=55 /DNA_END=849 /DNA_ORIENTATION=-